MEFPCPNFFDEFERIRTRSKPYNAAHNYVRIASKLYQLVRNNTFAAAAPQNLHAPAELLRAVVVQSRGHIRPFINPKIESTQGEREQFEGCGNLFLIYKGKRYHPGMLVRRPRKVTLSYRTLTGTRHEVEFVDTLPQHSTTMTPLGALVHEIDHLDGRLIMDFAYERLVRKFRTLKENISKHGGFKKELYRLAISGMPKVLHREGDAYVLRLGIEFDGGVPPVSPDAFFFDYIGFTMKRIQYLKVPRGGELLPVTFSKDVLKYGL